MNISASPGNTHSAQNTLDAALRLATLGWPVLRMHAPVASGDIVSCSCGSADCENLGKHPWTLRGYKDATTDAAQISKWWTEHPHANIAVAPGAACGKHGVLVLDIDAGSGGQETLAALEAKYGAVPTTVRAHSGGGGEHLYFGLPQVHMGNWVGVLPGLDIRTTGSCIIVPPSLHRSSGTYRWVEGCAPWEREVAEMPGWLTTELISAHAARKHQVPRSIAQGTPGPRQISRRTAQFLSHGAAEGERNAELFAAACDYCGCNISKEQAMADLGEAARRSGLDEREITRTIDSAYSRPRDPSRPRSDSSSRVALPRRVPSGEQSESVNSDVPLSMSRECGSSKHHELVTVRAGEDIVYACEVKIGSSRARQEFIDAVVERDPTVDRTALDKQLSEFAVSHEEFRRLSTAQTAELTSRDELLARNDAEIASALADMPGDVIEAAKRMLADPMLIDIILNDIGSVGVVGDQELALTTYILATSRLLERPLAAIVQGVTCSGKSYVPECASKLFPPEALFVATDITPNALFYIPPGGLMHRFVRAGERSRNDQDERAEATRALREMLSAGEISKVVPVKSPGGGPMKTERLHQYGPIAFIESTTMTQVFDEDANRCLLLGTDESQVQTAAIVAAQAARAVNGGRASDPTVIAKHYAAQRLLKRCTVRIPYAEVLGVLMPKARQDARRAMPHIIAMISAIALLHQRQRHADCSHHGFEIEATEHDYAIARRLLTKPMARGLGGGLPEAVIRFWQRLKQRFGDAEFSTNEALAGDITLHSKGKVNEYLRALALVGSAECTADARGNKPAYWRLLGTEPSVGAEWLPTIQQLREGRNSR